MAPTGGCWDDWASSPDLLPWERVVWEPSQGSLGVWETGCHLSEPLSSLRSPLLLFPAGLRVSGAPHPSLPSMCVILVSLSLGFCPCLSPLVSALCLYHSFLGLPLCLSLSPLLRSLLLSLLLWVSSYSQPRPSGPLGLPSPFQREKGVPEVSQRQGCLPVEGVGAGRWGEAGQGL